MSHRSQRKEKNCLNCGETVLGKFCQNCGQENTEPKETFWGMVMHFFTDITHFDGKFFTSLKDLIVRPGFLSVEYMRGRRASYLNPVRMYVFTSAIFFLIFFGITAGGNTVKYEQNEPLDRHGRDSVMQRLERRKGDKAADQVGIQKELALLMDTTKDVRPTDLWGLEDNFTMTQTWGADYKTMPEYDSIQQSLPATQRDGFIKRLWNKRAIRLNNKYKYDRLSPAEKLSEAILHKLPYVLFVSLPFFALILKLLYFRRKEYYYADHGIFSIHHYILSFILLLLVICWDELEKFTHWSFWGWMIAITIIALPVYLFKAMRRFYGQGFWKTFLKFFLLNIAGLIVLLLILASFSLFSVFQL